MKQHRPRLNTIIIHLLQCYNNYLVGLEEILTDLVRCSDTSIEFGCKLHEFETEKMCYLPVFTLVLKPAHRLVYYELVLTSKS